jgi:hypothetical protein
MRRLLNYIKTKTTSTIPNGAPPHLDNAYQAMTDIPQNSTHLVAPKSRHLSKLESKCRAMVSEGNQNFHDSDFNDKFLKLFKTALIFSILW